MKNTKQRVQALRIKMRNRELYLKGSTVITAFSHLQQIARTSDKVGKTRVVENIRASFQLNTRRVSDDTKLVIVVTLLR